MADQPIRRLELLELARAAGFSWGGDAGKELRAESYDGEVEMENLARLIKEHLTKTTRQEIIDELASNFNPDEVFKKCRVCTFPEQHVAAREIYAMGMAAGRAGAREGAKIMSDCLHNNIVAMQAALIEWKHGKGTEDALQWIVNTLAGPGNLPNFDGPYGKEAQAYFDANKADPFPKCECGRPSNILWMGKGFCSDEHQKIAQDAHAAEKASQKGSSE